MKIRVIGKARLTGTSKKTGNPYDFIQIHYNGPARNVDGLAALTLSLDPSQAHYGSIAVPGDYNVEFDNRGYSHCFDRCTGVFPNLTLRCFSSCFPGLVRSEGCFSLYQASPV